MAIIRTLMIAGAVLLHAAISAQAQRAPLQLLPGDGQATRAGQSGTASKAATRPQTKQNKKAAKKAGKAPAPAQVAKSRPAAPSASNRLAQQTAKPKATRTATTPARRSNLARARAVPASKSAQQAISAALPETRDQMASPSMSFVPQPSQQAMDVPTRSRTARPQAAPDTASREQASEDQSAVTNIMRDGDSVSLVGRLPWWRNDMQLITFGSEAAESQVMAAADAWLVANPQAAAEVDPPSATSEAPVQIADAREFNEIDRAASDPAYSTAPTPAIPTFLHSLIAIVAGAAAAVAVAAASARLLFA